MITELLTGPYLDRTKKYLFTLRATLIATTIITFSMIFVIPTGSYWLCSIVMSLYGLSFGPILPIGFDFSIQLTHPVQPALVNGLLQGAEQIGEFLLATVFVSLA
jgi:hypothetical protein